jgi:hypothetical protein
MVRTQIQLTENQARKIRRVAAEQNISFAEVVRQCIDQALRTDTSAPGVSSAACAIAKASRT